MVTNNEQPGEPWASLLVEQWWKQTFAKSPAKNQLCFKLTDDDRSDHDGFDSEDSGTLRLFFWIMLRQRRPSRQQVNKCKNTFLLQTV